MSYYLLDNRNPHGPHFYVSRKSPVTAAVVHITAGLEDLDETDDHSAERTAQYAATTTRKVSWHFGADTDSFLWLLPLGYTAWHCGGFNSPSVGGEISKRTTDWRGMNASWVDATLTQAARGFAEVVKYADLPTRRLSRTEANQGVKGFVGHHVMDPTRRSDPGYVSRVGDTFPWGSFLERVRVLAREDTGVAPVPPPTKRYDMLVYAKQATLDEYAAADAYRRHPAGVYCLNVGEARDAVHRGEVVVMVGGPAAREIAGETAIGGRTGVFSVAGPHIAVIGQTGEDTRRLVLELADRAWKP